MTGREELICAEMKIQKFYDQKGRCSQCGKRLPPEAQLAHRINQGSRGNIRNLEREFSPKYGRRIGKRIIHHRFNMALTCPGPCNSSVLVDNNPVERAALLEKILEDIGLP